MLNILLQGSSAALTLVKTPWPWTNTVRMSLAYPRLYLIYHVQFVLLTRRTSSTIHGRSVATLIRKRASESTFLRATCLPTTFTVPQLLPVYPRGTIQCTRHDRHPPRPLQWYTPTPFTKMILALCPLQSGTQIAQRLHGSWEQSRWSLSYLCFP